MDKNEKEPQSYTIDKIDDFKNDALGTLKQQRVWQTLRAEVIDALRKAETKINRAKKLKKSVRDVFKYAQEMKKQKESEKKSNKNLKEFFEQVNQSLDENYRSRFEFYHTSKEELEAIKDFVDFVKSVVPEKGAVKELLDVWAETLDRIIEDYPNTFDDYAKEVIREIFDAIFELEDPESDEKYIDKLDLLTSPFNKSDLNIAVISREYDADYDKQD